ncbi:TonB-dependent receptor [uncultured Coprobacter sp.]|uniref:SusC/RagA family TonB-linked outer membrane protein n=2 Tax=Bacteroidales TaxID=171549 RepID=UPI002595A81D|nr:TonB-dependent receptor [uncultured Coprobacter sp.]
MKKHRKSNQKVRWLNYLEVKWSLLFAMLLMSVATFSQQTVTGVVKGVVGEPLIGASVMVKGTTTGSITDIDGKFSIKASTNSVLVFTYVGYQNQEIPLNGRTSLQVVLKENSKALDEVVVVAYGVQKKESVVGAISQVKSTDLARSGVPTLSTSLAGRVPGMVTVQTSGMPGASEPKIFVRGLSSFTGNNQPLVLVDGVERPLSDIDASEVESVSVLKDASATAVYGVKGGNGVILVTTKRGKEGKMEISASVEQTLKQSTSSGIQENSYNTLLGRDKMYRNQGKWSNVLGESVLEHYRNPANPYERYIYPDFDAWEQGVKPFAWDTRASVSARGGTKFAKYFLMLSYLHEGDLLASDQSLYNADYRYDRMNYRMNFDFDVTKTTRVSVSSGGYIGTTNYGGNSSSGDSGKILNSLYTQPPYVSPFVYPAWFVEKYPDSKNPTISDRPAGNLVSPSAGTGFFTHNYNGTTRTVKDRFGIDVNLDQKLDFLTKGLSAKLNFSYNNYSTWNGGGITYTSDYYIFNIDGDNYYWDRYLGGSQNDYDEVTEPYQTTVSQDRNAASYDYVYSFQLNYARTFGDHTITGLGLFERRIQQVGSEFQHREEKWSARVTYDYLSRYMIEATLGVSGSERFAPANRFGYFPSVAVGWNIAKEPIFLRIMPKEFSNLKLRYSYGESGNDQVAGFLYISDYTNSISFNLGGPTSSRPTNSIIEGKVPNERAQWERAKKHNLGVDLGFFDNTLTLSGEFFAEDRDGILMSRRAVASWFGQDMADMNIGAVKRHGFEFELSYYGTIRKKLNYWIKGNYNYNENRITNQDDPLLLPDYQKLAGKPIGTITAAKNIGYYQNMDEMYNYNLSQSGLMVVGSDKLLDFNGDGKIDSNDYIPVGKTSRPNITYGISGGLEYKGFEFNFLVQGAASISRNWGNGINNPMFFKDPGEMYVKVKGRDDMWTPDNRDAEYATWGGWTTYDVATSKALVSGKYLRLKSLELAYSLKGNYMKKIGLSSARIALTGYNLLTWAPGYILGDPENEPDSFSLTYYPIPRRYTLSLQINF